MQVPENQSSKIRRKNIQIRNEGLRKNELGGRNKEKNEVLLKK